MKVGRWNEAEDEKIMIDGREVESVDAFCYLGSLMAADSSCDIEIKVCTGRANATFGRIHRIWKKNGCRFKTKIRLYNAISVSNAEHAAKWVQDLADDGGE